MTKIDVARVLNKIIALKKETQTAFDEMICDLQNLLEPFEPFEPFEAKSEIAETTDEPKTAHFCLAEFKCRDGTAVPKQLYKNVQSLMDKLETLRTVLGDRPIYISSAYRHEKYNAKIGGVKDSQHIVAKAADIRVKGLNSTQVYTVADKVFYDGGVGVYDGFVHVDVRTKKARWDKR